jgi:rod shape-determining protein MreC
MLDIPQQRPSVLRQRTGVLFVLALFGHLILISAQVQSRSGVPVLESVTFGAFSRVQRGTAAIFDGIRNVWGNYVGLKGARAENEYLRKQLADLEVKLQEQRALATQSQRLQELLDLRTSVSMPTVAAEVIAGNPIPGMLTVTIDRGTDDGVLANMAVIAPKGIVGRIVGRPAARAAKVQLIIDHDAAVGALCERTRSGGLVVGADADPPLRMDLVPNVADIVTGDLIVTSGVDGVYPKGLAIGRVEKSDRGTGLYRSLTVRPAVDFSSLEQLLVVLVPARGATPEPTPATPGGSGKPQ